MKIEPLPSDVRSYLRSGVAITSVTQCVEELVLNSLDAGATCVAVRVDLNCFKVQVVDNGSGVPNDQLEILGNRFCTSKCHALADLANLCHFGYRGEALASIRDSCGIVEITTRSKLCSKTYCKIFQSGKSLKVAESTIVRPSEGTTITVHDLFSNFPVRQKAMNKNFEIERIREMLEGIALIRPGISFTLRNDTAAQVLLSTRKCVGINSTFGQLYGAAKADMLVEVRGSKQEFCVEGYIGREGHPRKSLQFVYVNGRIVKKSRIHKLLNKMLLNLPALKPKQRVAPYSPQMLGGKQNLFSSPPKFSEAYPVYILDVKCPISEYDITFEPAKTIVEFKDWDNLLTCVEECAKSFLDKENIVIKLDEVDNISSKAEPAKGNDKQNAPVISADNMKDVISSKAVRKIPKQNNTDIVFETPDTRNSDGGKPGVATAKSTEEGNAFKTPANSKAAACKAAMGLGNRKLGVETDTDDTESELENSNRASDTSVSDESFVKETDKANVVNEDGIIDNHIPEDTEMPIVTKMQTENCDSEHNLGHSAQCSLSKFRQSIGKFTGKPAKKTNIDESLKKLNRIMPSSFKTNSKTLFSSLQKFRRKIETRNTAAEMEVYHEDSFQEQEANSPNKFEFDKDGSKITLHRTDSGRMHREDIEYIYRDSANKNESKLQAADNSTVNESADNKRYTEDSKVSSVDCEQSECCSSQEMKRQFQFFPCYDKAENIGGRTDRRKFDNYMNKTNENIQVRDTSVEPVETLYGACSAVHGDSVGIQISHDCVMEEFQNIPCHQRQNKHKSCIQESSGYIENCDKFDVGNSRFDRKRPFQESDTLHDQEKHFKYTARLLGPEELETELKYNLDNCDMDMCNTMSCDEPDLNHENFDFAGNSQINNCDRAIDPSFTSRLPQYDTSTVCLSKKQLSPNRINDESDNAVTSEKEPEDVVEDIDVELESNGMDASIYSTQGFSPRLSPQQIEVDRSAEQSAIVNVQTPESLGFTPKLHTQINTPGSTGFEPFSDEVESSIDMASSIDLTKSKNTDSISVSDRDIELNIVVCQKLQTDSKADTDGEVDGKEIVSSEDKTRVDGTDSESITLTQLLKTPTQKADGESNGPCPESVETGTDTHSTVTKRKGFSFGDLFSQTPSYSSNADSGMNDRKVIFANDAKPDGHSGSCSDCDLGMTNTDKRISDSCTEKGDNLDVDEVGGKNEVRLVPPTVGETVSQGNEILWTDSPWDISDSSFYLRDEMKLDEKDVRKHDEQTPSVTNCQGECKDEEGSSTDDTVKVADDGGNFDEQDMDMMESLNVWYKKLDAGISGTSDILQSKKPSDVVRKLHACRFSKDSLKSVKVLGQLDKKFIACVINTEQQGSDTDTTMLVLIDQHAAHERVRLEILTEEAFQDGVKGRQLVPFVVDPPQSMSFAEHEVRTILSFQDEYLRLGIKMKKDTATSVLLSSVPASLVDREKNDKIYWSTIQVLIREYISVFMSTRVSCGVLPQTIHKVLCSLACHGAIKFGDGLAADECVRLIKDLSRCDLPFQCAHGRPSVTPLFHMDKLQSLSHSMRRAKPKLWKLRQAMKMNKE